MNEYIYNILVVLLVINGLFWSLATHSQHCALVKYFKISKCPGHEIHILIGIISLLIAILIKQRVFFSKFI